MNQRGAGAKDEDLFSAKDLLEIVEVSLPKTWQSKVDLQGYTPTHHDKQRLIQECEAMERSEAKNPPAKAAVPKSNKHKGRNNSNNSQNSSSKEEKEKYFCTEHGKNPTHTTASCFTIKNRKRNENNGTKIMELKMERTFTAINSGKKFML